MAQEPTTLAIPYLEASAEEFRAYLAQLPDDAYVGRTRGLEESPVALWLLGEHNPTRYGAYIGALELGAHVIWVRDWDGNEHLFRPQGWMLAFWWALLAQQDSQVRDVTSADALAALTATLDLYARQHLDPRDLGATEALVMTLGVLRASRPDGARGLPTT